MALVRIRMVLEGILQDLHRRHISEPGSQPQEALLQRLLKENVFPRSLAGYADAVRKLGNHSVHDMNAGYSADDVYRSLSNLLPILEWYESQASSEQPYQGGQSAPEPLLFGRDFAGLDNHHRDVLPGLFGYCLDRLFPSFHLALAKSGIVPLPDGWLEINHYLRELGAHIEHDMRAKTYLPLSATPLAPIHPTHTDTRDPFVFYVPQLVLEIIGRSTGGDSASAPIAAASRHNKVVRNIVRNIDAAKRPLILLGEPGSGKTMTLQRAALTIARREAKRVYPRIPIYARLGEFHSSSPVSTNDILVFLMRSVPHSIANRLIELERYGRFVYFFDGMDEMSRDRYSEHVEALSRFASASLSQSLYSCRITDFNPDFIHQRLVLLPFDKGQVLEFLKRHIASPSISIEGVEWPLKKLAAHIMLGDLPIEADNPFILWLLCLYLQEQQVWPRSRVEMLRFYNERNYQRKAEEEQKRGQACGPFQQVEHALSEWARFAFTITERNKGSAIEVSLLACDGDSSQTQRAIELGKRCAVLSESRDKAKAHMIRFEHHRFQEFFAAVHILESRSEINWMEKLDAPRWQETMLNLILMGGGEQAMQALCLSVNTLNTACAAEIAAIQLEREAFQKRKELLAESKKKEGTKQKAPPEEEKEPELVLSNAHQSILSDRVELASRLMRQTARGPYSVTAHLMSPFRDSVRLLAEYGNPIAQLKVMRACQSVPDMEYVEALRFALNSPVHWLRGQALILIGSTRATCRAIGSDLATEVAFDLASGQFPRRITAYASAAKSGRIAIWWPICIAAGVWLSGLCLLIGTALVLFFCLYRVGDGATAIGWPSLDVLGRPIMWALVSGSVAATTILVAKVNPVLLWVGLLFGTFVASLASCLLFPLWSGNWVSPSILLATVAVGGFGFVVAPLSVISGMIHLGTLAFYLGCTVRSRARREPAATFLRAAWKSGAYGPWFVLGCLSAAVNVGAWLLGSWAIAWKDRLPFSLIRSWNKSFPDPGNQPIVAALWVLFPVCLLLLTGLALYAGFPEMRSALQRAVRDRRERAVVATNITTILGAIAAGSWLDGTFNFVLHWFVAIGLFLPILVLSWWIGCVVGAAILAEVTPNLRASSMALLFVAVFVVLEIGLGTSLGNHVIGLAVISPIAWMAGARMLNIPLVKSFRSLLVASGLLASIFVAIEFWPILAFASARVAVLGLLATLLYLYFSTFRYVWWSVLADWFYEKRFPPGSFSPDVWKGLIARSTPERQESILRRTDHQSLSLTVPEFLAVLADIRTNITTEPALSCYWEYRHRVEEALRQERRG